MKVFTHRTFGLLALFLLAAATSNANLITNGSFETTAITASPWFLRSFSSIPGWTQYADGVDLVHNDYEQGPSVLVDAQDGVQFLDMNQGLSNGGIEQVVSVTSGQTYVLSLYISDWATNSTGAQVTYSLYDPLSSNVLNTATFDAPTDSQWHLRTLQAQAVSGQLGVRIYGFTSYQAGAGVDSVSLDAATPEPSTAALATLALAALALHSRRKTV